ncbi:MAG TPA: hypothetical protein VFD71_18745 [Planctomycetota bacterium]|nr:hypothetical protein [Planctomycetota bacterium]
MTQSVDVARALERIAEIHGHLDRGEVYRGYRPKLVALTGLFGIAAALAQPWLLPNADGPAFLAYWIAVAALNLLAHWSTMVHGYLQEDELARRRTRRVVGQFVPSVAAGAIVTAGALVSIPSATTILPGIWSITFALGIFSSRPYLPRYIGWVGLWYLAGGSVLLAIAPSTFGSLGACLGAVFGCGQIGAAFVLSLDRSRGE